VDVSIPIGRIGGYLDVIHVLDLDYEYDEHAWAGFDSAPLGTSHTYP
jgi:hypothetical protein